MPAAGRPGWTFAGPVQRRLAVTAAVLTLLAAVITVNAARAHPERRVRTVLLPAPPAAVTVDASGCPVQAGCSVQQRAIGLDDAFIRAFPGGQVLSVQATLDLRTSSSYRKSLIGLTGDDGSTVSLVSQCVPGAPPQPSRLDRSSSSFTDLAGNSVVAYRQLSVLVPGLPGCGVALLLRTSGPAMPDEAAALRLAHDQAVQLPAP